MLTAAALASCDRGLPLPDGPPGGLSAPIASARLIEVLPSQRGIVYATGTPPASGTNPESNRLWGRTLPDGDPVLLASGPHFLGPELSAKDTVVLHGYEPPETHVWRAGWDRAIHVGPDSASALDASGSVLAMVETEADRAAGLTVVDLATCGADSCSPVRVHPGPVMFPTLSPGGRFVVFMVRAGNLSEIWIDERPFGRPRRLAETKVVLLTPPAIVPHVLDPSGEWLATLEAEPLEADVVTVRRAPFADSGVAVKLGAEVEYVRVSSPAPGVFVAVACLRDGTSKAGWAVYRIESSRAQEIARIELDPNAGPSQPMLWPDVGLEAVRIDSLAERRVFVNWRTGRFVKSPDSVTGFNQGLTGDVSDGGRFMAYVFNHPHPQVYSLVDLRVPEIKVTPHRVRPQFVGSDGDMVLVRHDLVPEPGAAPLELAGRDGVVRTLANDAVDAIARSAPDYVYYTAALPSGATEIRAIALARE